MVVYRVAVTGEGVVSLAVAYGGEGVPGVVLHSVLCQWSGLGFVWCPWPGLQLSLDTTCRVYCKVGLSLLVYLICGWCCCFAALTYAPVIVVSVLRGDALFWLSLQGH